MRATHIRNIAQREHRPSRAIRDVERRRANAHLALLAPSNLCIVGLRQAVARRTLAEAHDVPAVAREKLQQLLANELAPVSTKQLGRRTIGVGDAILRVCGQDAVAERIKENRFLVAVRNKRPVTI